jgi:hypothetical protein
VVDEEPKNLAVRISPISPRLLLHEGANSPPDSLAGGEMAGEILVWFSLMAAG